jgi:hypothetical protein
MGPVSHQTVRLEAGNHPHAAAGMCVLELASVLSDDEFSAYPASVCPVIAAFLRCYNDLVDDRRRQDLIGCAAAVVGSRATRDVETRRARLCRRWVVEVARPGPWTHPLWTLLALRGTERNIAAATYAAFVALEGNTPGERHQAALDLVARLLAEPSGTSPQLLGEEPSLHEHRRPGEASVSR